MDPRAKVHLSTIPTPLGPLQYHKADTSPPAYVIKLLSNQPFDPAKIQNAMEIKRSAQTEDSLLATHNLHTLEESWEHRNNPDFTGVEHYSEFNSAQRQGIDSLQGLKALAVPNVQLGELSKRKVHAMRTGGKFNHRAYLTRRPKMRRGKPKDTSFKRLLNLNLTVGAAGCRDQKDLGAYAYAVSKFVTHLESHGINLRLNIVEAGVFGNATSVVQLYPIKQQQQRLTPRKLNYYLGSPAFFRLALFPLLARLPALVCDGLGTTMPTATLKEMMKVKEFHDLLAPPGIPTLTLHARDSVLPCNTDQLNRFLATLTTKLLDSDVLVKHNHTWVHLKA